MKKLLFVIVTIITINVNAQGGAEFYDSTDYYFPQFWGKLFSRIDYSKATTGYLVDRAIHWIDPKRHTGYPSQNDTPYFETICSLHHAFKMAGKVFLSLRFKNPTSWSISA